MALLTRDRILVRSKDINNGRFDNAMVIKNIELKSDPENGDKMILTGKDLKCLLQQRVVSSQTSLSGRIDECIHMLLIESMINPDDYARTIPNFEYVPSSIMTDISEKQYIGDNLGDIIVSICEENKVGWKVFVDSGTIKMLFYRGEDRSFNQRINSYVVFSPVYENLLNSDYQNIGEEYKNFAYIGGEGEGSAQVITSAFLENSAPAGMNRHEMWIKASDLSSNDGLMSTEEYTSQLQSKGVAVLSADNNNVNFDGEVDITTQFIYGVDYFLGDIVELQNAYGASSRVRVLEVIESEDESGVNCIPTFCVEQADPSGIITERVQRSDLNSRLTYYWQLYYGDQAAQIASLNYPTAYLNEASDIDVFWGNVPQTNNSFITLAYDANGQVLQGKNLHDEQLYTRFNFAGRSNAGTAVTNTELHVKFNLYN
jgi:hypothetical protein